MIAKQSANKSEKRERGIYLEITIHKRKIKYNCQINKKSAEEFGDINFMVIITLLLWNLTIMYILYYHIVKLDIIIRTWRFRYSNIGYQEIVSIWKMRDKYVLNENLYINSAINSRILDKSTIILIHNNFYNVFMRCSLNNLLKIECF